MSTEPRTTFSTATLAPGYFALVMATGIVALDARAEHLQPFASLLSGIAAGAYVLLVVLNAMRLRRHRARVVADAASPGVTFTFLTFVAGSVVLASQPAVARAFPLVAALVGAAFVAWLMLLPRAGAVALALPRHLRHEWARGNWLLAVVSTQALAIGCVTVAPHGATRTFTAAAVGLWMLGIVLYCCIVVPVSRRLLAMVRHGDLAAFSGDFWITMGALAITTLAAARVVEAVTQLALGDAVEAFVRALGCVVWVAATGWIPWLVAVEVLRVRQVGWPAYDPARWSTVFPLGMYAAGSRALGEAVGWPAMHALGHGFAWLAFVAWTVTALGLVGALHRTMRGRGSADVAETPQRDVASPRSDPQPARYRAYEHPTSERRSPHGDSKPRND